MDKLKVGDVVVGVVTGIEKYGIFVSVDKYSGLIHISEISKKFVKNVSDYAIIGQKIKAKIVEVNPSSRQLKLSIKDFETKKTRKQREKIKETSNGFQSISAHLDNWISDKLSEINFRN